MLRLVLLLTLSLTTMLVVGCRTSQESEGSTGAFSTRSSRGDIAFDITPKVQGDGRIVVEVTATTHSGDLADLDLAAVLTLHANGKTYRPMDATDLRGHHSSGTVTFAPDDKPERFAVTLASVRNMGEQRFVWP